MTAPHRFGLRSTTGPAAWAPPPACFPPPALKAEHSPLYFPLSWPCSWVRALSVHPILAYHMGRHEMSPSTSPVSPMGMCGAHGADVVSHLGMSNSVTCPRFDCQGRGWANRDPNNTRKPAAEIVRVEFCMFDLRWWHATAAEDRNWFCYCCFFFLFNAANFDKNFGVIRSHTFTVL